MTIVGIGSRLRASHCALRPEAPALARGGRGNPRGHPPPSGRSPPTTLLVKGAIIPSSPFTTARHGSKLPKPQDLMASSAGPVHGWIMLLTHGVMTHLIIFGLNFVQSVITSPNWHPKRGVGWVWGLLWQQGKYGRLHRRVIMSIPPLQRHSGMDAATCVYELDGAGSMMGRKNWWGGQES